MGDLFTALEDGMILDGIEGYSEIKGQLPKPPEGLSARGRMQWRRDNWTDAEKAESLRRMIRFVESDDG